MSEIKPDIIAAIRLFSKKEGGRSRPLPPRFGCPIEYKGHKFDCKFWCDDYGGYFEPGMFRENIPIRFLWPEGIVPRLKTGEHFAIWEGGIIGEGIVTEILTSYESEFETYFDSQDLPKSPKLK